jgi:iron complex outermembrane receptor protein
MLLFEQSHWIFKPMLRYGLIFVLSPLSLMGQQTSDKDYIELEPFKVTYNRYWEAPENIPSQMKIWTQTDFIKSPMVNIGEVLEQTGGLELQNYTGNPGQGSVQMRGFGANSHLRVLVLIDGLKFNRPDMGGFNWDLIPLSAIDRIEVMPGSHSALYGNHAVGGVIQLSTLYPSTNALRGGINFSVGSNNEYNSTAWAQKKLGDAHVLASVQNRSTDGYRENATSEATSGFVKLHYQAKPDSIAADIALMATDSFSEYPGPLDIDRYTADPRQSVQDDQNSDERFAGLMGRISQQIIPQLQWEIQTALSDRELQWNLSGTYADNTMRNASISPQLRFESYPYTAILGGDWNRDTLDFTGFRDEARTLAKLFANLERTSSGAFALTRYQATPNLLLQAACRIETTQLSFAKHSYKRNYSYPDADPTHQEYLSDEKQDHGKSINLAINYSIAPTLRTWMRLDQIYRYPVTDEIGSYQGYELTDSFNTELEPETGWNIEWGWEYNPTHWRLAVTVFQQTLKGEIDFVRTATSESNQNLDDTIRIGSDLDLEYEALWGGFLLSYHYVDAHFTEGTYDGNTRCLVPTHQLLLRLTYKLTEQATIDYDTRYVGKRYRGDDFSLEYEPIPSHCIQGLGLSYDFTPKIHLFVRVDNIWDKQYISTQYLAGIYPGTGRTWRSGFTYQF